MKSDVNSYQYVKKNDNDFSFISTFFSLIGNPEYGKEAYSTLCTDIDSSRNNIWRSLSATASYVGEAVNTEILNYVDNICNVELCKIRQLLSLASYFGIKYSIFLNIQMFPRELVQLMDILSIKREFLADRLKVDKELAELISTNAMTIDLSADSIASEINEYRQLSGFTWSDRFDNTVPISVDFGKHLDDQCLNALTYDIVNKLLNSKLYMTYNDVNKTMICKHLSSDILEKDFELVNPNILKIQDYKLKWNISKDFNLTAELDKIENGETQITDYSNYELHIIQLEKEGRDIAFDITLPATRFKYYREAEVREYYKFIEGEYYNKEVANLYSTSNKYPIDNNYIELKSLKQINLLKNDGTFNIDMFKVATTEIVNAIEELRDIREQIKSLAQKNFMKGTFMLMSFAVNEYLNKTIAPTCKRLINSSPDYNSDTTTVNVVEYIDPTEYYNISCANDSNITSLNQRYWESGLTMQAIGAIDDTNIFSDLPTVDSQNIAFDSAAIEQFYLQTLQSKLTTSPSELQNNHLYSFLCTVFDFAAEQTTLSNGKLDTVISSDITKSELDRLLLSAQITYNSASSVLVCCDLSGEDNSLRQQLDTSISNYIVGWRNSFEEATASCMSHVAVINNDISSSLLTRVYDSKQQLSSLDSSYRQLVINNLVYTGAYDDSKCSCFIDRLSNYVLSVNNAFDKSAISAVSASMMTTCNQLSAKYTDLNNSLTSFNENVQQASYLSSVEYTQIPVKIAIAYSQVNISSDLTIAEEIILQLYEKLLSTTEFNNSISNLLNSKQSEFNKYVLNYKFTDIDRLSVQLAPYLDETADLSDFIFNQLPEMLSLSTSAIIDYKTALFKKYTGLEDSDAPYANIKNSVHPSYQIHPYLSTFVELYDYTYPIENIVNTTTQSIINELKNNIDLYIDSDGYLINLWKNPLNTNSDYISRYEKTSHIDVNNNQNKFFGYDGLFHPDALNQLRLSSDVFIENINPANLTSSNYYAGLDLTYDECLHILKQLRQLSSVIISEANSVHDIYRYGLDSYGNAYILVKDYSLTDINQLSTITTQLKKNTSGHLWMKLKNHPLAMPAYILSSEDAIHTEDISQLAVFGDEGAAENAMFTYSTIAKSEITSNCFTPKFYDFSISKDRTTFIAIADYQHDGVNCLLPLLATPAQKNCIEANKGNLDLTIYSLDKVKDRNNLIEALYYSNEISSYKFQCFFNKNFGIGAAYLSIDLNDARLKAAYYNSYTEEEHNNVKLPETTIKFENKRITDSDVIVDSYVDNTTGISKLVVSYLTDTKISNCSSYMDNSFNYDELSDYINTPTNRIVTRDIVIADNNLVKESELMYSPFSDCGFNPVLSSSNAIEGSKLETALTSFPTVMKFLLIGPEKKKAIDFINVLPVRMFDSYETNDNISCSDYRSIHFDEDNFSPIDVGESPIYDSVQFIKELSGSDVTIRIDESYKNKLIAGGYSEDNFIDTLIKFPYLWNTTQNANFPLLYVDAFNSDSEMNDNMEIKLYKGHKLSCSWKNIGEDIQLDFNSIYYTDSALSSPKNVFNRQHKFLSLKKAGDVGYLQEYSTTPNNDQVIATYYIKNISDDKPKFLLSAEFETFDPYSNFSRIVTEDDTKVEDTQYKRADLILTIDNTEYTLIAEDI